jgi:Patatin-like phospholipase
VVGEISSSFEEGARAHLLPCDGPRAWRSLCGLALALLLLLEGCATGARREAPVVDYRSVVLPGFPTGIRWFGETRQDFEVRSSDLLRQVQTAAGGGPVNVLVLSGGGAGAAFGAGALVGWSRTGTRPDFQIVTGVSAGALIAPLVFAGRDWDPQLSEAFSGAQTAHLMRANWMGALFGTSVYQSGPLARLIDRYLTDDLMDAVAREAKKGRVLLVATTDLDRARTVIWNLGLIAQQGGIESKRLFRSVLIASASVPGVFPPVMIPVDQAGKQFEEMHVDGGATAPLFFIPDVAAILPNPLAPLHGGHLYILVNGGFRTSEETTRNRTVSIIRRSATATLQGSTRAALEIAYATAQRHQMSVAVAGIPDAYPFGGMLDFDASRMGALFAYGEHCAIVDQLWTDPISALDQLPMRAMSRQCPGADRQGAPREQASAAPSFGDRAYLTPDPTQCAECVRVGSVPETVRTERVSH